MRPSAAPSPRPKRPSWPRQCRRGAAAELDGSADLADAWYGNPEYRNMKARLAPRRRCPRIVARALFCPESRIHHFHCVHVPVAASPSPLPCPWLPNWRAGVSLGFPQPRLREHVPGVSGTAVLGRAPTNAWLACAGRAAGQATGAALAALDSAVGAIAASRIAGPRGRCSRRVAADTQAALDAAAAQFAAGWRVAQGPALDGGRCSPVGRPRCWTRLADGPWGGPGGLGRGATGAAMDTPGEQLALHAGEFHGCQ